MISIMNKNITTKYLLQSVVGSHVETILSSSSKKDVIELYSVCCENKPEDQFQILKTEILQEVIAQSNDERQALLPLG
jgi:hypothetical protein